jgi:hypothetical protein
MLRKILLAAALVAAPWRLSAAPCGIAGSIVNGFEGVAGCPEGADLPNWTTSFAVGSVGATGTLSAGTLASTGQAVQEGTDIGVLDWTQSGPAVKNASMTLPSGLFPAAVGSNWSTQNYLSVLYSTTYTAYTTALLLTPTGSSTVTFDAGNGKDIGTGAWIALVLSLNYARNLGVTIGPVSGVQLLERVNPGSYATVFFDDLALTNTAQDLPNNSVPAGSMTGVAGCGGFSLSFTAQVQSGTDPITGYHVYRSTGGAAGPWISLGYVASNGTPGFVYSYTDNAAVAPGTLYNYIVLPYSSATSAFGSATGYFMYLQGDPGSPTNGVNEALLNPASQESATFDPHAGCSPTPSPTSSATATLTATITPTPTRTDSFTASPTLTKTFTASPSDTPTITPGGPTLTWTPTFSVSPTLTATNTPGGPTPTWTPSFTITPTFTASNTQVIVGGGPQIFPNPFHPDQGEVFHLGNVPVGNEIYIYNMIGQFVRKFTITATTNSWDGLNANGVKVVTGIYFVVIQNKIYRVAVVRS